MREHGNLILDFAKPTFFGGPSAHIVQETVRTLRHAVSRAVTLGKARSVVSAVGVTSASTAASSDATDELLEIYFEESGQAAGRGASTLKVGGLAVTYPTIDLAREFSRRLRADGLNWGSDCDDPFESVPTQFLKKAYFPGGQTPDADVRRGLNRIDDLAQAAGVKISAFEISADSVREAGLLSWSAPDAVYRLLLSHALEFLLFDWLPAKRLQQKPINIYVGTRMVAATGGQLLEYQRRFGLDLRLTRDTSQGMAYEMDSGDVGQAWSSESFEVGFSRGRGVAVALTSNPTLAPAGTPVGLLAYGFSSDDVYPLVTDLFRRRQASRSVNKALGVFLAYHMGRSVQDHQRYALPRQLHYATDWVVSKRHCVPGHWWNAGFREQATDRLQRLLRCSRAADDSTRTVEALRQWSYVGEHSAGTPSVDRYLLPRLRARVKTMTGEQFVRLGQLLAQDDN